MQQALHSNRHPGHRTRALACNGNSAVIDLSCFSIASNWIASIPTSCINYRTYWTVSSSLQILGRQVTLSKIGINLATFRTRNYRASSCIIGFCSSCYGEAVLVAEYHSSLRDMRKNTGRVA